MKEFEREEIPKYKKKKQSSTSKSFDKSKHKHDYSKQCIAKMPPFIQGGKPIINVAKYCSVCGKIGESYVPIVEDENAMFKRRYMSNEEILATYPNLDIVELEEHFQKYIPIVRSDWND